MALHGLDEAAGDPQADAESGGIVRYAQTGRHRIAQLVHENWLEAIRYLTMEHLTTHLGKCEQQTPFSGLVRLGPGPLGRHEPILAYELPDVLLRVQLGAFRRQR